MIEEEEFFAWLDGELDGDAAGRMAAAVAASPEWSAKAAQHRKLAAELRGAFDPAMESASPAPQFQTGEVIDFGARANARDSWRTWLTAPQWAAMAASLAIGVLVGTQFAGSGNDYPVGTERGQLIAVAGLDQALDKQLASAPSAGVTRIGITFRDRTGRICRSFTNASANGLACRDGTSWRIKGLYPIEGQAGDYRMAAGEDPHLAALIDESIAGEPFDSGQERAALAADWR